MHKGGSLWNTRTFNEALYYILYRIKKNICRKYIFICHQSVNPVFSFLNEQYTFHNLKKSKEKKDVSFLQLIMFINRFARVEKETVKKKNFIAILPKVFCTFGNSLL
jgi:hypothetical protein